MNAPEVSTHPTAPLPMAAPMSAEQLNADLNTIRSVLAEGAAARGPHRLIIAGANLVCGLFLLLVVPVMLVVFSIPVFVAPEEDGIIAVVLVGMLVIGILLAMAAPFLLAAWGLMGHKKWGPAAAVIAAIFNVLNFPLGTALAGYTLWAFMAGRLEVEPALPPAV